jgi:ABC-type Fe3+ transport system permease subunit
LRLRYNSKVYSRIKNCFYKLLLLVQLFIKIRLNLSSSYMEVSQRPGKAEESPGHRWAGIIGTGVAVVTLTLPIIMIASSSSFSSNAQSVPTTINQLQEAKINPME